MIFVGRRAPKKTKKKNLITLRAELVSLVLIFSVCYCFIEFTTDHDRSDSRRQAGAAISQTEITGLFRRYTVC